jgi:hypothetical protein
MPEAGDMHHHRLILHGPPSAVTRLANELCTAGAVLLHGPPPRRLVWTTPQRSALEPLCTRHRGVTVAIERFESLGDELERLVVQGTTATVLERRRLAWAGEAVTRDDPPDPDALRTAALLGGWPTDDDLDPFVAWGLCLDDDGAPLAPETLRAAALRVAAVPVELGVGIGLALDDALLLGPALGRLCVVAGDAVDGHDPSGVVLDAIARLASVAVTIGAGRADPGCAAELEYERAWRLTTAVALAGREVFSARPGDADWPEWLMSMISGTASLIESCAATLGRPGPPDPTVHGEHLDTADEHLVQEAARLAATCLQTLALFG